MFYFVKLGGGGKAEGTLVYHRKRLTPEKQTIFFQDAIKTPKIWIIVVCLSMLYLYTNNIILMLTRILYVPHWSTDSLLRPKCLETCRSTAGLSAAVFLWSCHAAVSAGVAVAAPFVLAVEWGWHTMGDLWMTRWPLPASTNRKWSHQLRHSGSTSCPQTRSLLLPGPSMLYAAPRKKCAQVRIPSDQIPWMSSTNLWHKASAYSSARLCHFAMCEFMPK